MAKQQGLDLAALCTISAGSLAPSSSIIPASELPASGVREGSSVSKQPEHERRQAEAPAAAQRESKGGDIQSPSLPENTPVELTCEKGSPHADATSESQECKVSEVMTSQSEQSLPPQDAEDGRNRCPAGMQDDDHPLGIN